MKKLFIIIAVALFSTSSFAQKKGDKCLAIGASASFGTMKISVTNGNQSVNSKEPMNTTFGLQPGIGFFPIDNLRLELCVGVGYQSVPTTESGSNWLHNKTLTATLQPSVSYYFKVADRLYYTPEIGIDLSLGTTEMEQSTYQSTKYKSYGLGMFGSFCAFEFKTTEKLALGLNIGSISYLHVKMPGAVKNLDVIGNEFSFSLNDTYVFVHYYF